MSSFTQEIVNKNPKRQKKTTKSQVVAQQKKEKLKKLKTAREDAYDDSNGKTSQTQTILSDELKNELGIGSYGTSEDLILPTTKRKSEEDEQDEQMEKPMTKARKLSAKQKKRMQNYQERKAREITRADLLNSLSENALTEQQMKLMHSSRTLGQKESAKERLRRQLLEARAGLPSRSDDNHGKSLFVEKTVQNEGNPFDHQDSASTTKTKDVDMEDSSAADNDDNKNQSTKKKKKKEKKSSEQRGEEKRAKKANYFKGGDEVSDDEEDVKRKKFKEEQTLKEKQQAEEEAAQQRKKQQEEKQKKSQQQQQKKDSNNNNNKQSKQQKEEIEQKNKVTPQQQQQQQKKQQQQQQEPQKKEEKGKSTSSTTNIVVKKEEEEQKVAATIPQPSSTKAFYVTVDRKPEIQAARIQLPVVMEEQRIMEAISENDVVIICGETGSGKTTQVPQFLYEAGYSHPQGPHPGLIGVTEPRRVAAISMAQRVSDELNLSMGKDVGYQIRYDASTVSDETHIKFMTDGILLKEIQGDFLLKKYSAIIIDEAHERSLNTDILIGLLSRVVPLRAKLVKENQSKLARGETVKEIFPSLKLIIMSATLRVEDFTKNSVLFPVPPPVINVDARQFPVTVHFNKRTPENYMDEAYRKVCKIHRKLPTGGVLVFLTGQQEIEGLCRRLRKRFPIKDKSAESDEKAKNKEQEEFSKEKKDVMQEKELLIEQEGDDEVDHEELLSERKFLEEDQEGEGKLDDNEEEEESDDDDDESSDDKCGPLYVLPLYSVLPTSQQLKVFQPPPEGSRLVVVATNVAETSLTIPGIKYVVDTGRTKELHYDKTSGISEFRIVWTSQASANQRAGRAGRTGPGHCYRLYSSAVFANQLDLFSAPEISVIPIEGIVLQMKSMGIENILNFPFPTPPDKESLRAATKLLTNLGALDVNQQKITDLGKTLTAFPVAPRFAKMLILAKQGGCLPYIIAIVAALSVRDPLLRDTSLDNEDDMDVDQEEKEKQKLVNELSGKTPKSAEDEERERLKKKKQALKKSHAVWAHESSDLLGTLKAIGAFEFAGATEKFCDQYFLHYKSMQEIRQLRQQLTNIVKLVDPSLKIEFDTKMPPPSKKQELIIRQVITAGLIDQVARLYREGPLLYYLIPQYSTSLFPDSNPDEPQRVFIHPSSFVADTLPEFCCYREINITSRPYMRGVTVIHPSWLATLGEALCHFSQPLEMPAPKYDPTSGKVRCFQKVTYGPHSWELPIQEREFPESIDKYKYFARFLLEGQIVSDMKQLENAFNSKPAIITKSYTQNKVIVLVQALKENKIDSVEKLLAKWQSEPKFLLSAVSLWVDRNHHKTLSTMWPPAGKSLKKKEKGRSTSHQEHYVDFASSDSD